jgi:DNA primase
VLQHYGIELRSGRGAQWKALCPFHRDARPSLNLNFDMKVFNCFPCGVGGDIVKFVAKKEHPSDPEGHLIEAAEKLAEICGIRIDNDRTAAASDAAGRTRAVTKEAVPVTSSTAKEPHNGELAVPNRPLSFELKVDPTHPYLTERGLSPETVATFGLGYCVSEMSIMRQRIVIPVHNQRDELVAYAGRWPGDSGWPDNAAKYMLPPKFQKMRVLFNLNRVIQGMFEGQWPGHEQHVVIVEGFFGAFAVHRLAPCVAIMGLVLSNEHLELLVKANVRFVTLLLDGPSKVFTPDQHRVWADRITATILELATYGFFVRVPQLEIGEQPDTISRERLAGLVSL